MVGVSGRSVGRDGGGTRDGVVGSAGGARKTVSECVSWYSHLSIESGSLNPSYPPHPTPPSSHRGFSPNRPRSATVGDGGPPRFEVPC